jgi:hypothetical protein
MTAAVALTGIVAWLTFQLAVTTAATGALALTPFGQAIYVTPLTWILMLAPLGQCSSSASGSTTSRPAPPGRCSWPLLRPTQNGPVHRAHLGRPCRPKPLGHPLTADRG